MQAVILAGGLGTRLGALTRDVPKPMMPVAGKPYLEHQLRWLSKQGITKILLLTGYLGEQIQTYFGNGSAWGLEIRYSREQTPMGTGGGLRDACRGPRLASPYAGAGAVVVGAPPVLPRSRGAVSRGHLP